MHVTPAGYPASRWLEVQTEGYPATQLIASASNSTKYTICSLITPLIAARVREPQRVTKSAEL
jgi:hypothetical protein